MTDVSGRILIKASFLAVNNVFTDQPVVRIRREPHQVETGLA
jgi:hypothetical protein